MALNKKIKTANFNNLGLDVLEVSVTNGTLEASYEANGSLKFTIVHDTDEFKVGHKVGVLLDTNISTENKVITEAVVESTDKIGDYSFKFVFRVQNYDILADDVTNDVLIVKLLDYKHTIPVVEKNNVKSYITYYFDNSARLDANGTTDILAVPSEYNAYYNGTSTVFEASKYSKFKHPKYPIIDFFHREFTQTLENGSVVWVRREAAGGVDKFTYGSAFAKGTRTVTNPVVPKTNYLIEAAEQMAEVTDGDVKDKTAVKEKNGGKIELPSTTAKFIGYPRAKKDTTDTDGNYIVENADAYFFLRPIDAEDRFGKKWEDDTNTQATWYINGAHYLARNPNYVFGGKKLKTSIDEKQGVRNDARGETNFTIQHKQSFGSDLIPGDGNEFYNIKFWRNDCDESSSAIRIDNRKGIKFDNCIFEHTWDGYAPDNYDGSPLMGKTLSVVYAYDISFKSCKFIHNSAFVNVILKDDAENPVNIKSMVIGKNGKAFGEQASVYISSSGNIFFDSCESINNYGQVCYEFDNADNVDMEKCSAETYYNNTRTIDNVSRNILQKPMGYYFYNNSTSLHLKGNTFYGDGMGFYLRNITNMVYPLLENCKAVSNGDEAFVFENVKFAKLRECEGETIANSVFSFRSCIDPILYSCKAESDTGYGFEFIKDINLGTPTKFWRTVDCHNYSGSGLLFDETSFPGKIDFGTFIQTANSYLDVAPGERSLIGVRLHDAPYKATFRNMYFKGIQNDIDIDKGNNVELYLENSHFAANQEISGEYSSPAYFIHKGFSGVWEYRDVGGSITTSAVNKVPNSNVIADKEAGFSLSFKSSVNNELGRPSITLGNSNEETQYLDLKQGKNRVTVYLMGRLLDVENPLTNQDIWIELRYKDRSPGDPHIMTASSRGDFDTKNRLTVDESHKGLWQINKNFVPDAKEFKIELDVEVGQDCSCPLTICYEYYTTIGEIYVDPYARVVQLITEDGVLKEVAPL